MKASSKDLRSRGKPRAVLVPVGDRARIKTEDDPAFGPWRDHADVEDVDGTSAAHDPTPGRRTPPIDAMMSSVSRMNRCQPRKMR